MSLLRSHKKVLFGFLQCIAFVFLFTTLAVASSEKSEGTQSNKSSIHCLPRPTGVKPPRLELPKLRRIDRKKEERYKPLHLAPVCPEGQIPEYKIYKGHVGKGNPLLGVERFVSGADPFEKRGEFILKNLRPFKEVYWKDRIKNENYKPLPPDPSGKCDGVTNSTACYYYASAAYRREADGGGMTMRIESPAYNGSGGSGHSLDEIAVQGGTGDGKIVELGWNVSTDQYGDSNPHLFVFHWIDWNPTCYDGCGWQQWSSTYFPGMDLGSVVGRQVYIGYVYWEGNWWAWFDNQWLGYFPESEWSNNYKKSQLIQWFGEVASNNGIPPKTDMGDGLLPANSSAAFMSTLCDVNANDWICWYRDQQSLGSTVPNYYDINRTGFGATRFGGPGE